MLNLVQMIGLETALESAEDPEKLGKFLRRWWLIHCEMCAANLE
jgi:hypothetical protein